MVDTGLYPEVSGMEEGEVDTKTDTEEDKEAEVEESEGV